MSKKAILVIVISVLITVSGFFAIKVFASENAIVRHEDSINNMESYIRKDEDMDRKDHDLIIRSITIEENIQKVLEKMDNRLEKIESFTAK
jgi:peptidoglycan hydrolase CwlO-like protein